MSPLRLLTLLGLIPCGCSHPKTQGLGVTMAHFSLPGHYTLGGFFPIYSVAVNLANRTRFSLDGYEWALAMTFAIDEINNASSLLPGVTLGYEIYNSCHDFLVAVQPTMRFMSGADNSIAVLQDYTRYQSTAIAIIGPATSDLAIILGTVFGLMLIPQISYGASSETLSNKDLFPSFLRTIPSDKNQAEGMVALVKTFGWNWIAVVGSDDEYGRQGIELFSVRAAVEGICIAHIHLVPSYNSVSSVELKMATIIGHIQQSQVNVIVLFSNEKVALTLLRYALKHNITDKVWIGSEAWVTSNVMVHTPGLGNVGTVIGFVIQSSTMPGFQQYISNLLTAMDRQQSSVHTHSPTISLCFSCLNVSAESLIKRLDYLEKRQSFNVYTAVYSVAHALHQLLGCDSGGCRDSPRPYPWQLLDEVRRVAFEVGNRSIQFDNNGNPKTSYEIILWKVKRETALVTLSQLDQDRSILTLMFSQVPESYCSKDCVRGQMKKAKGLHSCCSECIDCPEDTFQNASGCRGNKCINCHYEEWSPARSSACFPRSPQYLAWSSPMVVLLLLLVSLSLALTGLMTYLFVCHSGTPMVKASGGRRTFGTLTSLAMASCSSFLYLGEPTEHTCKIQQPVTSMCLSFCMSTLLGESLQILLTLELGSLTKGCLGVLKHRGNQLVVLLSLVIQVSLCYWWLTTPGPFLIKLRESNKLLLFCKNHEETSFWLMLAHSGFQSLSCFMCTFLIQNPANTYKLARDISLAMLLYFLAWVAFIPTYSAVSSIYAPVVEVFTVLGSTFGILGAYFVPKCWIIHFKPHCNTEAYFQVYNKRWEMDKGRERNQKQQITFVQRLSCQEDVPRP
uniref:Taste receptor type 1 member 3 n=1 Tax=Callorhinchus milii TaxID=7868 RepID=A0A4W3HFD8_CALMI